MEYGAIGGIEMGTDDDGRDLQHQIPDCQRDG
jgi:hypothetical protein